MALIETKKSKEQKVKLQEMELALTKAKVQLSTVLALQDSTANRTYVGNEYRSYEAAIAAIQDKYNATAEWGTTLTGNIIDLRAAFIIQNGLKLIPAEGLSAKEAEKELAWGNDFLTYNKLDRELTHTLATEAEIEGKIAFKIALNKINEKEPLAEDYEAMTTVRYISYIDKKYEVETDPEDYMDYISLTWKPTAKTKGEKLKPEEFVYNKFGGRITKVNEAQPKIMKCLTQIDDVDRALRDWREIDHIFATPILDIQCETDKAVDAAKEQLSEMNMKIKKAFIHTQSKADILAPDMAGTASLEKEITTKIKIISGVTAIPVHFIGLLDLLKNRSTGEETRGMVISATTKERKIWEGTYNELMEKSMLAFNNATLAKRSKPAQLDPRKVKLILSVYSQEQWNHIEKVLLPMFLADALSIATLLSAVPDLDADAEMAKLEKTKEEKAEQDANNLTDNLNFNRNQDEEEELNVS